MEIYLDIASNIINKFDFIDRLEEYEKTKGPLPALLRERLVLAHNLDKEGRYLESYQNLQLLLEIENSRDQILELKKVFGGDPRPIRSNDDYRNTSDEEDCDACLQGFCLGLALQAICGNCK